MIPLASVTRLSLLLLISVQLLACCSSKEEQPAAHAEKLALVDNCYKISPKLLRSGQPSRKDFRKLEQYGIKTVLNLREYHSDDKEARGTGIKLLHIPLAAGSVTEDELLVCLLAIKKAPAPVLVHCWHGSDRTGIVCAAYRIAEQGWTPEAALQELTDGPFGHHEWYYSNLAELVKAIDWQQFTEKYKKG